MKKTIVILAKSIKNGHFCIAGKDLSNFEWIRPVSTEEGGEITKQQSKLTYQGAEASPWDCCIFHNVEIDFQRRVPLYFQPENYLISTEHQWIQKYRSLPNILESLLDSPVSLWGSVSPRINKETIIQDDKFSNSLYLIKVQNLKLYINEYKKRKVSFEYKNVLYSDFSCTDPSFDSLMSQKKEYCSAILCISLGELFKDNFHYKIVASIFVI
ncbi:TPA: hypothetical protein ACPG1Q_000752 [Haemophilus influenzae 10810]